MFGLGPAFIPTLLFILLSPGLLVTLPPKGKGITVILVHAVLFAILLTVVRRYRMFEGFTDASGNVVPPTLDLPKVGELLANMNGAKPVEKK